MKSLDFTSNVTLQYLSTTGTKLQPIESAAGMAGFVCCVLTKAYNSQQRVHPQSAGPASERALLLTGCLLFGFTLSISLYMSIKGTQLDPFCQGYISKRE